MKSFSNILCIINELSDVEKILGLAMQLAADNQAKLTMAMVIKKPKISFSFGAQTVNEQSLLNAAVESCEEQLEQAVSMSLASLPTQSQLSVKTRVLVGTPFMAIIQTVLADGVDFVVKCQASEGWLDGLFGSDDMYLLRKCPCPVLMLKNDVKGEFKKILSTIDVQSEIEATDESEPHTVLNHSVVKSGALMALADSADFHIGSVWDAYGENFLRNSAFSSVPESEINSYVSGSEKKCLEKLDQIAQEVKALVGPEGFQYINCQTHLKKGSPCQEIVGMVNEYKIDLLVMGTVARTGLPGFVIGNTAESVLKRVNCSVLALKPKGFQTPITLSQ